MPRACDKASRYPGVAFHHARYNSKYKDAEFLKVGQYRIRKLLPDEEKAFRDRVQNIIDGEVVIRPYRLPNE